MSTLNKACKIGKLWTEPIGSGISTKLKSIKTYLIDILLIIILWDKSNISGLSVDPTPI